MSNWSYVVGAVGCATLAVACSSDSAKTPTNGPEPAVSITEPADKATVIITDDPDVPVAFTVTNFTLKEPGKCAGASACGHVHVLVDGHSCDDHENGEVHSFNAESATSPVGAGLDYCTDAVMGVPVEKSYPVVVSLYGDDEAEVKDSSGKAVSDSIEFSVKIMSPADAGR
jgi:hypothetical protein